ncbi:hypothetical protein OS493_005402 [Desmophyllum pertusum]|uniref:Uncharacterized protein n=1 Tax=Desmophyllum pertusum TaxID=174260 RepID=A0A9W9YSA1_9CNID|nr:hypothetical protein OS493_005402 [Desmophyllum pertusum]
MIAAIEVVLYFDIPHKKGLESSPASVKDWTRGSTKKARSRDSFQRVFVPSSDWTQGLETLQVRAHPLLPSRYGTQSSTEAPGCIFNIFSRLFSSVFCEGWSPPTVVMLGVNGKRCRPLLASILAKQLLDTTSYMIIEHLGWGKGFASTVSLGYCIKCFYPPAC